MSRKENISIYLYLNVYIYRIILFIVIVISNITKICNITLAKFAWTPISFPFLDFSFELIQ